MFCIYIITCLINLKVYIGKTNDPKNRWLSHTQPARLGYNLPYNETSLIQKAIKKHGVENCEFYIIEDLLTEKEVLEREKVFIAFYKSNICRYGNLWGYNLTDGGDGISGHKHTEESKKKMSLASKGKPKSEAHKKSLSIGGTGKVLSEAHKEAIRISNLGKKCNDESRKKMSQGKLGVKNPQSILTEDQVREIRKFISDNIDNWSSKTLDEKYGVAPRTIRDIANKKTWASLK
jgi:group I intron endonuclease